MPVQGDFARGESLFETSERPDLVGDPDQIEKRRLWRFLAGFAGLDAGWFRDRGHGLGNGETRRRRIAQKGPPIE